MDVPEPLQRQVGPFPLVVWGGLIGGGVGLGLILRYRMKRNPSSAGKDNTLPLISDADGNPTGVTASTAGVQTRGGTVVVAQPATNPGSSPVTSNMEWARNAIAYLISIGTDPAVAQAAITRFIDGSGLTAVELGLVSKAIGATGPPPEYVAPPTVVPAKVPDAPPGLQAPPSLPAVESITPPGALISPDGNLVFHSDGVRVKWVQNGNESKALAAAGARVKSMVNPGTAEEFPEPVYASPAAIRAQRLVGPPPPGWSAW